MKNIVCPTRTETASRLYNISGGEEPSSPVVPAHSSEAIGDDGSKEPHGPLLKPKLQLRIPANEIFEGDLPGLVRLFRLEDSKWTGCSVTDDCARRLLHERLVELMYRKGKVKGIRPVPPHKREPVKVVIIRGQSLGKPYLDGATWMQPKLPDWVWHELFYAVMASCRPKRIEPWTWDEILNAAREIQRSRRPRKRCVPPPASRRHLAPPLKTAA